MRRNPSPAPVLVFAGVVALVAACATSVDTTGDSNLGTPDGGDDSSDAASNPDFGTVVVVDGDGDDSADTAGDDQGLIDMGAPDLGSPDVAPFDGGPTDTCDPSNGLYQIEYLFDLVGGTITPCSSACTSSSGNCCYMNLDCVPL
jgi:hypothetical protein